ncbi:DNA circularization N-terminal domain-containing protein [uncultured Hoeflea sp.]|uniref:DNA circularization N-terminal domain-containing protein n=1 Tax=uncultured Hoeflea sp. TaxID=538666 RepID=UPI00262561D6|nr:DNA circularization N-terminal domain-containing protein [uncultured Hoeflea sp.]
MARDWVASLRQASYRGVPFYVHSDGIGGGRRLVQHDFAGGEAQLIEDFGAAERAFDVDAYVVGDESDAAAQALLAALDRRGPARLTLPLSGPVVAQAVDWWREWRLDKLGYCAFILRFVRGGSPSTAGISAHSVSGLAAAAVSSLSAAIAGAFP